MRKRFPVTPAVLMVLLLVLAPFFQPAQAQESKPFKIGLITDLSDTFQLYGVEVQNGLTLGLDYATGGTMAVNHRPVEILVRDTPMTPDSP
jgi:branched-chain amino acid transport system substrate-binding protein